MAIQSRVPTQGRRDTPPNSPDISTRVLSLRTPSLSSTPVVDLWSPPGDPRRTAVDLTSLESMSYPRGPVRPTNPTPPPSGRPDGKS